MILRQSVTESGCASYLVGCEAKKVCVIIDPLVDVERMLQMADSETMKIIQIVDTHIHADHISGARILARKIGSPIMMHATSPARFGFKKLEDRQELEVGDLQVQVIFTPGHTPEHICLLAEDSALMSGDCLLIRDVGRTDLGRGDANLLLSSLNKLLQLPDSVKLYPAHTSAAHGLSGDISSTIWFERKQNPALQIRSAAEFAQYMAEGWPPKPIDYQNVARINTGELPLG